MKKLMSLVLLLCLLAVMPLEPAGAALATEVSSNGALEASVDLTAPEAFRIGGMMDEQIQSMVTGTDEFGSYQSYSDPRELDSLRDYSFTTTDGVGRSVSGFADNWLVLIYGRTTCMYCNMMTAAAASAMNAGKKLSVVFLCIEETDAAAAAAFANEYPGILVSTTYSQNSSKMWSIIRECGLEDNFSYLPGLVMLNEDRALRFVSTGPHNTELEQVLETLPDNGLHSSGLSTCAKLSDAEIRALLNAESLTMPSNIFVEEPSVTAPYAAGKVSNPLLQRVTDRLNVLRAIAGLNPVELDEDLCESAQYGAVLLAASEFSHYPAQPEDMGNDFYERGLAATSSSNIYAGLVLLRTPDGFMDDSDGGNVSRLGHRRWQLNPALGKIGFGYATTNTGYYRYTAEKVFDSSGSSGDYDFIAWPASGHFPADTAAFDKDTAWSVTLNPQKYQTPTLANLTVTIRRESDGYQWLLSGTDSYTAASSGHYLNVDTGGYGVSNCVIFRPDGITSYEGCYTVSIDGLRDKNGQAVPFAYQVDFFDSKNDEPSNPSITRQPENFYGSLGDSFFFSVSAGGSGLSYQWQFSTDGGKTWKASSLSGNKTDTLTGTITAERLTYSYRCVISVSGGSGLISNEVVLVDLGTLNDAANIEGGSLSFTSTGDYPWFCVNNAPRKYVQSGNGGAANTTSTLTFSCTITVESTLSFEYKAWGEGSSYDVCCVIVDGETVFEEGALQNDWTEYSIVLNAGNHTVQWQYSKDSSVNPEGDYFAIDNVKLTPNGQPVKITTQPKNYGGAVGGTATATVKATGDGLTYQWYFANPGDSSFTKSGNKTATYSATLTEANSGRRLYCVVKDTYGNSVTTKTVTMSIAEPVTITTQPKNYGGAVGSTATATVKASGDGLTYQWYFANPGDSSFTKSGNKTATYSATLTEANSGRRLYCVVKDTYGNSVTTKTVTMSIAEPVTITTQPKNYGGAVGSTATATVKASGDGLTYQWYFANPGDSSFTKSGNKTATYSATLTEANSGRRLYCVVKDTYGNSVTTKTVTMSIADPVTITTQPKNYVGAAGSTATATVKASGDGLTYQWYFANPGDSSFTKSGSKTATYSATLTEANSGRRMYCVITDTYGNTAKSNTVTMTVGASVITIKTQPKNYVGAVGSTATATVKATGEGLTYQWYFANPGATGFTKSGSKTATYSATLTAANSGRRMYCVITDAYGNTAKTNTVTMTATTSTITITTQPKNYVGAAGSTATATVKALGESLTYQWYFANPGETSFTKSGSKTATYSATLTEANSGRRMYCVITDAHGNTVTTNTVTMTVG